jgi:GNAT superfamily N-acetyltransferase
MARKDSKPLGVATFSILYPAPDLTGELFMKDLFTIQETRGKGVGTAILRFLARYAIENNCSRFDWTAERPNAKAVEFYEGLGIPRVEEKIYYRPSGDMLNSMAAGKSRI